MAAAWPPRSGRDFIRSNEFGELVSKAAEDLASFYPRLDFSDAAAAVFVWFDRTLMRNRRFINAERFTDKNAITIFVRQQLVKEARAAVKRREKNLPMVPLTHEELVEESANQQADVEHLLDQIDRLDEPKRTIFERYFLEEEDFRLIASYLDITEEEAHRLYIEAIDDLRLPRRSR